MKLREIIDSHSVLCKSTIVKDQIYLDNEGYWDFNYADCYQIRTDLTVIRNVEGIDPKNSGPDLVEVWIRIITTPCGIAQLENALRATQAFIGNLELDFAKALSGPVTAPPRIFCFDWTTGQYQHTPRQPGPPSIVDSSTQPAL